MDSGAKGSNKSDCGTIFTLEFIPKQMVTLALKLLARVAALVDSANPAPTQPLSEEEVARTALEAECRISKRDVEAMAYADLNSYIGYTGYVTYIGCNFPRDWEQMGCRTNPSNLDPPLKIRIDGCFHLPEEIWSKRPDCWTNCTSRFNWETETLCQRYPCTFKETGYLYTCWRVSVVDPKEMDGRMFGFSFFTLPAFRYNRRVADGGRELIYRGLRDPKWGAHPGLNWLDSFTLPRPK
jgi:hypothetical protein